VRARAVLLSATGTIAVLVLGVEIGNAVAVTPSSSGSESTTSTGSGSGGPSGTGSSVGTGSSTGSAALKDGTFSGDEAQTPFGPVQVKVTVSGSKITNVTPLELTTYGGRSVEISNYAAPIIRSEVIKAQSANVSNVSGATYTTEGYLSSLQSALNKAKA
jgi:uncharacterized protein with FMN-binding domain